MPARVVLVQWKQGQVFLHRIYHHLLELGYRADCVLVKRVAKTYNDDDDVMNNISWKLVNMKSK